MASSAKYRFFHWDNKQTYPSWYNQPKSGNYTDWLSEKLEDGLFQQYDRQDPTEPIEPTEAPAEETYVEFEHPAVTLSNSVMQAGAGVTAGLQKALETVKQTAKNVTDSAPDSSGVSAKPIIYSDWSPASKLFGMSQETAYTEHMANTAHQREVADLKAAGLNPVLGISGSGSSVVSGNSGIGASSAEKVEQFPWMDVLGATAGLVTTVVTKKPALGYMVANVFKAFDK